MKALFISTYVICMLATGLYANTDSLRTLLVKEKDIEKKIDLYNSICESIEGEELFKTATEFLNFSLKNKAERGIALAHDNFAYYYMNIKPDSAIKYYNKALEYYTKKNIEKSIAYACNQLGVVYFIKGDLKNALDYYLKSLNYGKPDEKTAIYGNIGMIYAKLGEKGKAKEFYIKAQDHYLKTGNKVAAASMNNSIGVMLTEAFQYDEAEKYLLNAINVFPENTLEHYHTLANLGLNYTLKGEPEKGKVYLLKAVSGMRKANYPKGLAFTLANLGITYSRLGKNQEAIKFGTEAFELSEKYGFLENIEKTSHMLSSIYQKAGDTKNALKFYKTYFETHDSIVSEKVLKELNSLNTKYESSVKDLELTRQKEAISRQEALLQKQIAESEKKKKFIYVLLFAAALISTVAFLMFRAFKQKQKANEIILKQKQEVEQQKSIIEEQKKEVLDSIHYARRIQFALLAHSDFLKTSIPQHFILFKPKDIVSGDFYWAQEHNENIYIAVCDCTGHGVPGAFMSVLNIGFLNEAIKEKNILKPNEIFNYVRRKLIENLSQEEQKDGMDGIILCINKKNKSITYSAANNEPVLIHNGAILELEKDKMPVGKGERLEDFHLFDLNYQTGDTIYLYTDGYADQFGGPKGKKFKYKQLNDLLLQISASSLQEQKNILEKTIVEWKGNLEQVDDLCIMGIKL